MTTTGWYAIGSLLILCAALALMWRAAERDAHRTQDALHRATEQLNNTRWADRELAAIHALPATHEREYPR